MGKSGKEGIPPAAIVERQMPGGVSLLPRQGRYTMPASLRHRSKDVLKRVPIMGGGPAMKELSLEQKVQRLLDI